MSNIRLPEGKTSEQEQKIFTFKVTQLTQLTWLVFSILQVLIILRLGLKIVWAIEKVRSLLFHRAYEPVVSILQTRVNDRPIEVNPEKNTRDSSSHKHENPITRPKSIFVGLLVGSLAGVGATLLLAPQSGGKMRAKIQQKGVELRKQIAESVKTVEDAVAQVYVDAHEITHDVGVQAEELKQRGQTILNGLKEG